MNEREMFNIYYLNFTKVYELKMFFSNIVQIGLEKTGEKGKTNSNNNDLNVKFGTKLFNLFDANASAGISSKKELIERNKLIETFEIKATKSVILDEVYQKATDVNEFCGIYEGELIKIRNVKLKLTNEEDFRSTKLISNGIFKNMHIPETEGFDINNMLNSILKDYSYKLNGKTKRNEEIIIKIPLSTESEFESGYIVDDTFIGDVTILGIYKGRVLEKNIKNSYEYFNDEENNVDEELNVSEIIDSRTGVPISQEKKHNDKKIQKVHYIDLLAILQPLKIGG